MLLQWVTAPAMKFGIEAMEHFGFKYKKARRKVINYLKGFNKKETILIGWDINNDLIMFDRLFNLRIKHRDINKNRWLDLARVYKKLEKKDKITSLKNACEEFDILSSDWHNATVDTVNTYKLFIKLIEKYSFKEVIGAINEVSYKKEDSKYSRIFFLFC